MSGPLARPQRVRETGAGDHDFGNRRRLPSGDLAWRLWLWHAGQAG